MSDPVTPIYRQNRPELSLGNADFAKLWGVLLMCVAYGAVATLCLQCFAMFVKGFKAKRSKWHWDGLLILYVVLIFVVSTIYTGATMQLSAFYFIDIDYPDFLSVDIEYSRLNDVSYSSLTVSGLLSDALLLWRCTVVYKNSFIPSWLTISAALTMFLAETILGVVYLVQAIGTDPKSALYANILLASPIWFWCLSLAVNILITVMITGRILFFRRRLAKVLGHGHVNQYTGALAMIIESALLFSIYLIIYIASVLLGSPLYLVMDQAPSLVQAVSALLIVYRVTQGKAWMSDTRAHIETLARPAQGRPVQLGNMATPQAAGSTPSVDDVEKSPRIHIRAALDVGSSSDSGSI